MTSSPWCNRAYVLGAFHALVEAENLFYAPDPNSADMCMIGGNVAENAGGPRAFKYGSTRDHVLGLETCFMGGKTMRVGKRCVVKERDGVRRDRAARGERRDARGVQRDHAAPLAEASAHRDAAPRALHRRAHAAGASVSRLIAAGLVPRCIEMMDDATRSQRCAARRATRSTSARERDAPHRGGRRRCRSPARATGRRARRRRRDPSTSSSRRTPRSARALWRPRASRSATRRASSPRTRSPRTSSCRGHASSALLKRAEVRSRAAKRCGTSRTGHAGDGNLHVNFLWDTPDEEPRVARRWVEALMRATIDLGGTLS